jgi:hypothetical protein
MVRDMHDVNLSHCGPRSSGITQREAQRMPAIGTAKRRQAHVDR